MTRRSFLKLGFFGGLGVLAVAKTGPLPMAVQALAPPPTGVIRLIMQPAYAEMVDTLLVPVWVFGTPEDGPRLPGPVILAEEGMDLEVEVTNSLSRPHAFAVPGVVDSGPIEPGETRLLGFPAPTAGTYLYFDPTSAPVHRAMGLHGALVTTPPPGSLTPYSRPTTETVELFSALGTSPEFPGDAWVRERTWIWLTHSLDTAKHVLADGTPAGREVDPDAFLDGYLPEYFTLNGKSGFFSGHDPDNTPHGNVGQPALLRVLNAGLTHASMHIHGNHVFLLAENGQVRDNIFLMDTWTMNPLDRRDLLHPFVRPPDAVNWPPSNLFEFPMPFPMHDHNEQSQTAAGGNYPQGLVTDWEITSPRVGGPEAPPEEFPPHRGHHPALFERA